MIINKSISLFFSILICGFISIGIAKQPQPVENIIVSTEQVLKDVFKADPNYIARFLTITQKANITLDKLFLGQVDAETEYTAEERAQIVQTLETLVAQQFNKVTANALPTYTASAGAPGTGKTFALEERFEIDVAQAKFPANAIYVGPDSVVLPQMQAHIEDYKNPEKGPAKAYTKWRDASNYIANFMLVKAMTDGLNIVHDTTSTSTRVKTILDTLGELGYQRHIHFYIADKDSRAKALMYRKNKLGFAMVTISDAVTKAEAAYERLADHSYEGRVESLVLYRQTNSFWLGNGDTVAFAIYNPAEKPQIQVLEGGKPHVNYILQQAQEKESLKQEILSGFKETVKTWTR